MRVGSVDGLGGVVWKRHRGFATANATGAVAIVALNRKELLRSLPVGIPSECAMHGNSDNTPQIKPSTESFSC